MMPLLTMLSMTGVAAASAAAASSCLPALSARVALRMALRSCEVRASLRARCTVDCRAAFSADFVFAKRGLLQGSQCVEAPKRAAYFPVQALGCQIRRVEAGGLRIICLFSHGTRTRSAQP